MVGFRQPDYGAAYLTKDLGAFREDELGFARVQFAFSRSTRYPCLSVFDLKGRGLIYPLEGKTSATADEIALARRLGAEITILRGLIIPWMTSEIRPFEPFSRLVSQMRAQARKEDDELSNQLWKLYGNSVYGKTAQGVREDTNFDNIANEYQQMPPSRMR